jgi:hypothetical protein
VVEKDKMKINIMKMVKVEQKVEQKEEVEVGEQIKSKKDKIINKMMKTII